MEPLVVSDEALSAARDKAVAQRRTREECPTTALDECQVPGLMGTDNQRAVGSLLAESDIEHSFCGDSIGRSS